MDPQFQTAFPGVAKVGILNSGQVPGLTLISQGDNLPHFLLNPRQGAKYVGKVKCCGERKFL